MIFYTLTTKQLFYNSYMEMQNKANKFNQNISLHQVNTYYIYSMYRNGKPCCSMSIFVIIVQWFDNSQLNMHCKISTAATGNVY